LFGCNSSFKRTEDNTDTKNEKIKKTEYIKTPAACLGFWIHEDYLKALRQTHSTKKASEMGVDDFYRISNDNSVMRLNLHEGGAENILLMTTKSTGQIFSPDTSEAYFKVEFKDKYLIIENNKYIKAPAIENGLAEIVNRTLFSGQYLVDDQSIEFQENGQIIGLDSIVHYEANLDYADAGMQYDKIYLQFKEEKEPRTYLYEFVSDTLVIYNLKCLTMDEEYNYCVEVEKGNEFMKLKKK
jgi:hypothetical protein